MPLPGVVRYVPGNTNSLALVRSIVWECLKPIKSVPLIPHLKAEFTESDGSGYEAA